MIETVPSGTILNGRYRIERVLGSGGFGHVYLALDQNLNQPFAVKEYLVSGPSGQEQLMHEANVLSQLHHPNLPAFHDAFYENGRYYVVLNYIEGNDLTDIIRNTQKHNGVVPISKVMAWILATCDAVFFLHSQHPPVIHRDIKPDNIRITSDETAILVDLGNAKAAADGVRTLFFIRHQGTPGYAPPEQYPGGSGTDTRSDIYALGGTLYFALTGQEPPSVSTRNQSMQQGQVDLPSLQEVLAKNPREDEASPAKQFRLGVSKPAKPAPRHSHHLAQLATLSPLVLAQLNLIIQKAMAMRPKERYQSVADLTNDLKKVVALMPAPPAISFDTQPIGPTQNPYKTQPDLPMMYDRIQQTRASQQAQQQTNEPTVAQVASHAQPVQIGAAPPTTPPISQELCPYCGAPHKIGASFCSRCGKPLRVEQKPSSTNSGQPMATKQATPSAAIAASTPISPPEGQSIQQRTSAASASPRPVPSLMAQQADTDIVSPWNTAPITPPTSSGTASSQSQMGQPAPDDDAARLNIGLILVVVLVIVLIILMVILVILLMQRMHQAMLPLQFQLALLN